MSLLRIGVVNVLMDTAVMYNGMLEPALRKRDSCARELGERARWVGCAHIVISCISPMQ